MKQLENSHLKTNKFVKQMEQFGKGLDKKNEDIGKIKTKRDVQNIEEG